MSAREDPRRESTPVFTVSPHCEVEKPSPAVLLDRAMLQIHEAQAIVAMVGVWITLSEPACPPPRVCGW